MNYLKKKSAPGFLTGIVMLILSACKKENGAPMVQDPPLHLLKTVSYTDNYDNVVNNSLQYDANNHLQQLKTIFSNATSSDGYYRTYTWTENQILTQEYGLDGVEIPTTASTYTLNARGFLNSHKYKTYDANTMTYPDYKNLFEYTPDNYLKRISNYYAADNSLKYAYDFYYGNNNRLDSIAGYRTAANNSLQKNIAWIFEYDEGKQNTIGNSWMSSAMDDAVNLGGKSQSFALKKETLVFYNGQQQRSIIQVDSYENQYDVTGRIVSRSMLLKYFQEDGSVVDSLKGTYVYTYQ